MTGEKDLAPEMPSSSAKQSSQGRRAATIAVALPIVLLFVWLGGWFLFALLTFVLCMMTMELRSLMLQASHRPVLWFSFALALFLLASAMFPQQRLMLLSIGAGLALLLSFPLFFMRAPEQRPLNDWG
ncbi:hypothetical protein [Ktedonobacter robiniae]|uniref:Phosphatidate cytidylyltransferase n=1 Tax=Ktedonobacter robiniae TaxID=2778365 RepID=A0ABQ3V1D1_9CHLR|nr:hypothetical protein [Ktedonobacter robiniae]GHO58728.1 hypothetical protein KSB_72030 [Ktedonobacter robiniae]